MKMCHVGRNWNQEALDLKEHCHFLNFWQMDLENGKNRTHTHVLYVWYTTLSCITYSLSHPLFWKRVKTPHAFKCTTLKKHFRRLTKHFLSLLRLYAIKCFPWTHSSFQKLFREWKKKRVRVGKKKKWKEHGERGGSLKWFIPYFIMSVRDYKSNIPFPKNIKCQSKCTHGPQSLKWVSLKSGANALV